MTTDYLLERLTMTDKSEAAKLRKQLRNALADYMYSEGCSCCENTKEHNESAEILAKLLNVNKYSDGAGYDFFKYRTTK